MLIVDATKEDSIDKALKKYKKKYEKAGVLRQLRRRKAFAKPSVERRTEATPIFRAALAFFPAIGMRLCGR